MCALYAIEAVLIDNGGAALLMGACHVQRGQLFFTLQSFPTRREYYVVRSSLSEQ